MKKLGRMLLATLCAAMLMTGQLNAAGVTTFGGTGTIDGESLEVSVTVKDTNVYSGKITMEYDSSVVELVEANAGTAVAENITSIDASEKGVVTIGFASLEEVTAGEILNVDFKVVGEMPEDGYVFAINAVEWSGEVPNAEKEEAAYDEYELLVTEAGTEIRLPGTGDETDEPGNEGGNGTGTGTGTGNGGDLDTGDDTNITPYIVLIVAAVVVGGAVVIIRKKKTVANN